MNEDEVVEEERAPGLVLMGFGKHKLKDMLEWIGTEKEEELLTAFKRWPPVYREERIADQEDIKHACQYLAYLQDSILEYELNNPSEEGEENTNE